MRVLESIASSYQTDEVRPTFYTAAVGHSGPLHADGWY
jgi:hypothetical protein